MMPMMNALLLGMLAAMIWKEEVTHNPTMMLMMNMINFCWGLIRDDLANKYLGSWFPYQIIID
jgi:hypothetical protein